MSERVKRYRCPHCKGWQSDILRERGLPDVGCNYCGIWSLHIYWKNVFLDFGVLNIWKERAA